jgi:mannose-6-phosphate isomerase-like protein (cupin superfamily)
VTGTKLAKHPIHLGRAATAEIEPVFTGAMEWYADYGARHAADGSDGRLVSLSSFCQSWRMWEMHPRGSEVVLCLSGTMTLHQEQADGTIATVALGAGEYAINPPMVWHTADVDGEATALFITAGAGTQHRPRQD